VTLRPVGRRGLRLSVVVTTYENPRALALVLAGLFRQSVRDFELLIADDGSGAETAALVAEAATRSPVAVRHVWHEDAGFRKCTITNKAIAAAEGDYLIFFDGDCVATRECLAIHLDAVRPDSYLAGGAVPLTQRLTDRLTVADVRRGLLDGVGMWWLDAGKRRRLVTSRMRWLGRWMNARVPREPSWRGGNSSAFAEHLRAVGGFDERFTHGFEDADLGHRLQAHGIHGRSVRYTAPVFHLEHTRPYARPEALAANRALYEENRARRATRTAHGLQAP
jgi:glycosyltransferase involved in cell wall biosynthesis